MANVVVCKLEYVVKHPNADRLQIAKALGNTVIVGLDNFDGQLGLFFEDDSKLGESFAKANDLTPIRDEFGKKINSTFFDDNLRVRCLRLRGVKCEGYWVPISFLAFTGYDLSKLKEYDCFDTLNGHLIVEKYVTKATREKGLKNNNQPKKVKIVKVLGMDEHFYTSQFRHVAQGYKKGEVVYISAKLHGTSQRFGFVEELDETPRSQFLRKWLNKVGISYKPTMKRQWKHIVGTRRVILKGADSPTSFYGNEQFRYNAVKDLYGRLEKEEVLFMELVGYQDNGKPIMEPAKLAGLKDKSLVKKYGEVMHYKYGNPVGQCSLYCYRIARTNEDGKLVDLSWTQMVERCEQLGVKTPPLLVEPFIYDGNEEKLRELVDSLVERDDPIDPSHVMEGLCVRVDRYPQPLVSKQKSFLFKLLEGMIKDEGAEDMEESA